MSRGMSYLRFAAGRALIHAGLKVLPPGRCRQELSAALWTWSAISGSSETASTSSAQDALERIVGRPRGSYRNISPRPTGRRLRAHEPQEF